MSSLFSKKEIAAMVLYALIGIFTVGHDANNYKRVNPVASFALWPFYWSIEMQRSK